MATAPPPPPPPPIHISPHLILQAPLTTRGHGPGLILVVDHYALLDASDKHIDPPPLTKWAEEGFAVAQVLVPGKVEDGGEFPLERAITELRALKGCVGEGIGLISYLSRIPFYVEEAACLSPEIKAIISYGGRKFTTLNRSRSSLPPQLVHVSGTETQRRDSLSLLPTPITPGWSAPPSGTVKSYRYIEARKESGWYFPADEEYHAESANLAHTRSLTFLKPLLNGPYFDLEAIWQDHCDREFNERDVERTMETMVAEPYVNHIPTLTGGIGREALARFYKEHFCFRNPEDTALRLVSRTVGVDRLVDEFVFACTHDGVVDWLLPNIPPTHQKLEIPFTAVIAMRGDRLCHEHISWDQATALRQIGLLPEWTRFPYAIEGKEPAPGKRFEVRLPVVGVETAKKLVDESCVGSNELIGRDGGVGWREVDDV